MTMIRRHIPAMALALLLLHFAFGQNTYAQNPGHRSEAALRSWKRPDTVKTLDLVRTVIPMLASQKTAGRRTGTAGNLLAAKYIAGWFNTYGLQPVASDAKKTAGWSPYYHYFPYVAGATPGAHNTLSLKTPAGRRTLKIGKDFTPALFSTSAAFTGPMVFAGYGIQSKDNNYDDYAGIDAAGKVVVIMRYSPDGSNPHGNFARASSLTAKVSTARQHKAAAIIFINQPDDSAASLPPMHVDRNYLDAGIPAMFVSNAVFSTLRDAKGRTLVQVQAEIDKNKQPASFDMPGYTATGRTEVKINRVMAPNVIGIIPGNDPQVKDEIIVIGGHFDHLGDGGEGSLWGGHEPAFHHGADDNASGSAGVVALAAAFGQDYRVGSNRRTLMFVTFNGEEEGLLGSAYLTEHFPMNLKNVVAMINMDMIGRLDSNRLIVQGTGTSPLWEPMMDSLNAKSFELKFVKDGFGPSDHSSFYTKDIPVLFFFTGLHKDYHRPTDTYDKINYEGEAKVLGLVQAAVRFIDNMSTRPVFTKVQVSAQPRTGNGFRVYVGTIPDYAFEGKGLRLSGVADGGPAQKAGLQAGDIVIKMDGKDVNNIYDYTYLLGEFKPKQQVATTVLRAGKELTFTIEMGSR